MQLDFERSVRNLEHKLITTEGMRKNAEAKVETLERKVKNLKKKLELDMGLKNERISYTNKTGVKEKV